MVSGRPGLDFRNFYPRSPCGERLSSDLKGNFITNISIHALLAESDAAMGKPTLEIAYFYPRSPCGERRGNRFALVDILPISIHALLAESDN